MNENQYDFDSGYVRETLGSYTARTFFWMFLGLLTTFGVAWFGARSGLIWRMLYAVPTIDLILMVAQIAVVLVISFRLHKIQISTAYVLFFAYSILTGVTFATLFLVYELGTLILAFGMAALYFGVMALYGYVTKTDLSRLRPVLMGGLITLIVCGLISFFLPLSAFQRLLCLGGVALFMAFTAYDTQKIKRFYHSYSGNTEMLEKASVLMALELYLDFIHIFLDLLSILGKHKD